MFELVYGPDNYYILSLEWLEELVELDFKLLDFSSKFKI